MENRYAPIRHGMGKGCSAIGVLLSCDARREFTGFEHVGMRLVHGLPKLNVGGRHNQSTGIESTSYRVLRGMAYRSRSRR